MNNEINIVLKNELLDITFRKSFYNHFKEITEECKISRNNCEIKFKNGSKIKIISEWQAQQILRGKGIYIQDLYYDANCFYKVLYKNMECSIEYVDEAIEFIEKISFHLKNKKLVKL